jgi:hypothetical protein
LSEISRTQVTRLILRTASGELTSKLGPALPDGSKIYGKNLAAQRPNLCNVAITQFSKFSLFVSFLK